MSIYFRKFNWERQLVDISCPSVNDWIVFELQETLGEGAFGVVVKGKAPGLERCQNVNSIVAIKMLKADATDNELMDLLSEMDTMKRIGQHINIINFLG